MLGELDIVRGLEKLACRKIKLGAQLAATLQGGEKLVGSHLRSVYREAVFDIELKGVGDAGVVLFLLLGGPPFLALVAVQLPQGYE